jgi:hypothetical protein
MDLANEGDAVFGVRLGWKRINVEDAWFDGWGQKNAYVQFDILSTYR